MKYYIAALTHLEHGPQKKNFIPLFGYELVCKKKKILVQNLGNRLDFFFFF